MDFFTRFTCEKTPQNNFPRQNFGVENVFYFIFSTLGGYTFDKMGFENSTLIVIGMQLIALVPLFVLFNYNRNSALKSAKKNFKRI